MALNISPHPDLITLKPDKILCIVSFFAPAVFKSFITTCFNSSFKLPKTTFPASSIAGSPDNNKSFIFPKLSVLCFAVFLSATVFHAGNIESIS